MTDETRGAVTRLAAEVVRAACGLADEESPQLDMGAEAARIMAIRAKDELNTTRAALAAEATIREALEGQLREVERERDALRRHYDAASPEHNLLALLDLYETRRDELEAERDAYREKAERLSEQVSEARQAIGAAWFLAAESSLAEAIERKCSMLERDAKLGAAVRAAVEDVMHDRVAAHYVMHERDDVVIDESQLDVLRAIDAVLQAEDEASDA